VNTTPRKTVAVDLDGVLADYSQGWRGLDHIGDPIPGACQFLIQLSHVADVLIWTTRCSVDLGRGEGANLLRNRVRDWLEQHGMMPYVADIWTGQGKPIAAAFIDDRAVTCRPQESGTESGAATAYLTALRRVEHLLADVPPGCSLHHATPELAEEATDG
jgi:hypothetical protein